MQLKVKRTYNKLLLLPTFLLPFLLQKHYNARTILPDTAQSCSAHHTDISNPISQHPPNHTSPHIKTNNPSFPSRHLLQTLDNSVIALYRGLCINWRHGTPKTPHARLALTCGQHPVQHPSDATKHPPPPHRSCERLESALFWHMQKTLPPQICSKRHYARHPRLLGLTILAPLLLDVLSNTPDLRGVLAARFVSRNRQMFNLSDDGRQVLRVVIHVDGEIRLWKQLRNDESELLMKLRDLFDPWVVNVVRRRADFDRFEEVPRRQHALSVYVARSARSFGKSDEYFCMSKAIVVSGLGVA